MTTLNLSPNVLRWAAGNIGMSIEEMAEKVGAFSKLERIVAGEMTPIQAQNFARLTRIPFGFLFLKEPPAVEKPSLPDLRQLQSPDQLSLDFYDTLRDIIRKQDWYIEYLNEIGADKPEFVGKYRGKSNTPPKEIAFDISKALGINANLRAACATTESYFSKISQQLETLGILVFKTGIVQSNTSRPLPVSEFRGFAIAHEYAPLIFINGQDSPSAWIFTLIHEAAHIWLGESGISDISASIHGTFNGIEQICNQVAAEVLTPKDEFLVLWKEHSSEKFTVLSRKFKVSKLVIARRALDFGKITRQEYLTVVSASKRSLKTDEPGGDPYRTIPVRSSKKFTNAILASAMSGRVMLRDAGSLLNIKPSTVIELSRRR